MTTKITAQEYLSLAYQSKFGKKLTGQHPEVIDLVFERFNATIQPSLDNPPAGVFPDERLTYEEWEASEWGQFVRGEIE